MFRKFRFQKTTLLKICSFISRHWMVKQTSSTEFSQNDSNELNRRLLVIEEKQRQKESEFIQKQKLLKYKLKVLKQHGELSRLKGIVSSQKATTEGTSSQMQASQLDGNETDDDSDFQLSEDSDEEEDTDLLLRQTRSQSLAQAGAGTSANLKENLVQSFIQFLNITEISEHDSDNPLKVLKQFVQCQELQKGKVTKGITVKSSKRPDDSESSQYQSAIETDQEDERNLQLLVDPKPTATFMESYVTSFELELDSQPIDTLKITATADEASEAYLRFLCKYGYIARVTSV